jgi:ribosome-associated protein
MPSIESNQLLLAAAAACEDKKAEDIRILALDPAESGLTDYFLICNGTNERQNVAITDEVELRLKREFGVYPNSVEGRRQGEWILMDYVDFIVHVFSTEKRAFYGLERLRKSATTISVADLNADVSARIAETRAKKKAPAKKTAARVGAKKAAVKTASPTKVAAKKSIVKKPIGKSSARKIAPKKTRKK